MAGEDAFRFLNATRSIAGAADWNDPRADRLWRYNLHYFDDLNAAGREHRSASHSRLVVRWVEENPPGKGAGWEPYPLSLRVVNWIKWTCSGFVLPDPAVQSLATQVRYLTKRLEYHLLGNHLLANAKALVFAGLFFEGDEAEEWLRAGLGILESELSEQILPDGGHFERSPMYHSIVLADVLELLAAVRAFPLAVSHPTVDRWARISGQMFGWLAAMCHAEGDISFFNDAAFGVTLTPAQLRIWASELGIKATPRPGNGVVALMPSGYVRIRRDPWLVVFDAAPIGPDYIPGHAHADTLSFELSWGEQRVIVNSGTSTYNAGSHRSRERSTAAHNTVEVDGENSSEVWSAFRVARRAVPFGLETRHSGDVCAATCCHDGYRRLRGAPVHRRAIEVTDRALRVSDTISGSGVHAAKGFFHFHPAVHLEQASSGDWVIKLPQGQKLRMLGRDGLRLQREEGIYAPEFGKSVSRAVLAWRIERELPIDAVVDIVEER